MKSNGTENRTLAICFGQFGPCRRPVHAVTSDKWGEAEGKADEVRTLSSQRSQSRGSKEQDRPEAEDEIGGKKNLL